MNEPLPKIDHGIIRPDTKPFDYPLPFGFAKDKASKNNRVLTEDQLNELRQAFKGYDERPFKHQDQELAEKYGVSLFTIRDIRCGYTYKDVNERT